MSEIGEVFRLATTRVRTGETPLSAGDESRHEGAPGGEVTDHRKGKVARLTGLEPATPGVTGRYSNQLSYNRA